jgi:hypothetical protein
MSETEDTHKDRIFRRIVGLIIEKQDYSKIQTLTNISKNIAKCPFEYIEDELPVDVVLELIEKSVGNMNETNEKKTKPIHRGRGKKSTSIDKSTGITKKIEKEHIYHQLLMDMFDNSLIQSYMKAIENRGGDEDLEEDDDEDDDSDYSTDDDDEQDMDNILDIIDNSDSESGNEKTKKEDGEEKEDEEEIIKIKLEGEEEEELRIERTEELEEDIKYSILDGLN